MLCRVVNYISRILNFQFNRFMNAPNNIFAELKEVNYQPCLVESLLKFDTADLVDGNLASRSSFILNFMDNEYAVSQWVSPKRTRSFPYARVYDTLHRKNRVTLIPVCKDEGADGDRDFIQWDTISLMSLLNVHVIICYYTNAEKNNRPEQRHKNKITKQVFDYQHIHSELCKLQQYQSSALHWNLEQAENVHQIAQFALTAYQRIGFDLGVAMHSEESFLRRINAIKQSSEKFRELSRQLAAEAQHRETLTDQPKEKVTGEKATVTLKNLLGGEYYFTVDEFFVLDGRVFLVEKKHSAKSKFPSANDIKDAFIKLALFSNINKLTLNEKEMPHFSAVGLTSNTIQGVFHSKMEEEQIAKFFNDNEATEKEQILLRNIVAESQGNNFGVFAINADDVDSLQKNILRQMP